MEYWFRAKRLSDNQWEYGGVDDKSSSIIAHYQFIPIDPDTLGLHTGAHDVHLCGIYHGDILRFWVNGKRLLIVIQWDGWRFAISIHENSETSKFPKKFSFEDGKIVGNLWDGIQEN